MSLNLATHELQHAPTHSFSEGLHLQKRHIQPLALAEIWVPTLYVVAACWKGCLESGSLNPFTSLPLADIGMVTSLQKRFRSY